MSKQVLLYDFQEEHLELINPKAVFSRKEAIAERVRALRATGRAEIGTLKLGDEVIAIIGMNLLWPGVAEVWSVISEEARTAPIGFHRSVLRLLDAYGNSLGLHRIQMTVREDYLEGRRWAQSLGFMPEGVLRQYGPDRKNHMMYARVK